MENHSAGPKRIDLLIPGLVHLLAIIAFVQNRYTVSQFPLDDAWIHRVYARSVAWGQGFAYNTGQQEAGSSSPLWAILTAPLHWLEGFDADLPVWGVKVTSILLSLWCVLMIQRIVHGLTGSRVSGIIAASLFAVEPILLFSSFSGMETNLLVTLIVGSCLALIKKRVLLFLILIGLAPVARPEAVLFLPMAMAAIKDIARSRQSFLKKSLSCLLPFLPMLCWSVFCLSVTGHPFPNTFYVKAQTVQPGLSVCLKGLASIGRYGEAPGWLVVAGIAGFCVLCYRSGKQSIPVLFCFLVLPFFYIQAIVFSRTFFLTGYYWTRWTDPGTLLIAAAFGTGCGWFLASPGPSMPAGWIRWLTHRHILRVIRLLFLVCLLPALASSFVERRSRFASDSRAIEIINVNMGKWIHHNTPEDAVVSVNDAGAIRYFGDRYTIDLAGLNNAGIAFKRVTPLSAIFSSDWLAIFPAVLQSPTIWAKVLDSFDVRFVTSIPSEEYTVCDLPGKPQKFALERKPGPGRQ